jgi:hypothetical protein
MTPLRLEKSSGRTFMCVIAKIGHLLYFQYCANIIYHLGVLGLVKLVNCVQYM